MRDARAATAWPAEDHRNWKTRFVRSAKAMTSKKALHGEHIVGRRGEMVTTWRLVRLTGETDLQDEKMEIVATGEIDLERQKSEVVD